VQFEIVRHWLACQMRDVRQWKRTRETDSAQYIRTRDATSRENARFCIKRTGFNYLNIQSSI
jgi:hypothetical protein